MRIKPAIPVKKHKHKQASKHRSSAKPPNPLSDVRQNARAKKLAAQLALFDSMPDSALVALPVVCALKGRAPASIWRDVAAGRLSKPIKAGPRSSRWQVGGLRRGLAAGGGQ